MTEKHDDGINRRKFVGLAAGGVVLAAGLSGAAAESSAEVQSESTAVKPFELEEVSIGQLQQRMTDGSMTAEAITTAYLARIDEIDKRGPAVNAVIELNPDALAIAAALDRERKEKGSRGPMHGIPILIKDNIDTADRMRTSAGSLALAESIAQRDAFIVERLRAAGAVILGKTNLSEWANFRSTHSTSGWSARAGQTRNPYALDRNPCGSSSGSGAAISASLCAVGIGTETDGSIVCPSTMNGLVGIKPTVGLVSRTGIIPIAASQDTAGPMARSVTDAAILLGAIAGVDSRDAATAASGGNIHSDYTKYLDPAGLAGARIGIARKFFGFSDHVDLVMKDSIDAIKKAGAVLIDPADMEGENYDESEYEVLLYEFKAGLETYLAGLGDAVRHRTLKDLIAFNEEHRDREMPFFGQEIFTMAVEKGPLTSRDYRKALAKNHKYSREKGIDAVMKKHRLDALFAPTGSPAWPTDPVNGDHYTGGFSSAAAVAGYPHITVPAGFIFGLPVGVSFFGRAWSEPVLIRIAYAFEQITKARRAPRFLPTISLDARRVQHFSSSWKTSGAWAGGTSWAVRAV